MAGAIIGAASASWITGRFGRRPAILLAAVLFAVGALVSGLAPDVFTLIAARVVVGLGIGLTSVAVPMYIAETSPRCPGGALVTLYQLAVTIGILIATLLDEFFHDLAEGSAWRWDLGVAFLAAVVLAVGMLGAPESPRYLVQRGRDAAARAVLAAIQPSRSPDETIGEIRDEIAVASKGTWRDLLAPSLRAVLVIGVVMAAVQQFTGINTVIYYDVDIIQRAGITDQGTAIWGAVAVAAVNVLATLIAIRYVDRVGRRPLLMVGLVGMAVGLALLGVGFELGGALAGPISLAAMMLYIVCFAFSLGPIVWVLISEIYPLAIRGPAMSLATMVNWASNLVVALTFLTLLDVLGDSGTFWLYAAICLAALAFVWRKVPETKGKSLEEIAADTGAGEPAAMSARAGAEATP
jgi:sugar porter (SP) family MFS transporter